MVISACDRYVHIATGSDVIRHEPMRLVCEPSGQLGGWVATATRCASTDTLGLVERGHRHLKADSRWPGVDRDR